MAEKARRSYNSDIPEINSQRNIQKSWEFLASISPVSSQIAEAIQDQDDIEYTASQAKEEELSLDFFVVLDTEKEECQMQLRKKILQYAVLLEHVENCVENKKQYISLRHKCDLEKCSHWKEVIRHSKSCNVSEGCPMNSSCLIARQIRNHWDTCNRHTCIVCLPKKSNYHKAACKLLINMDFQESIPGAGPSNKMQSDIEIEDWRQDLSMEFRDNIVQILIDSSLLIKNARRLFDLEAIIPDMIQCGKKVENYFYEIADSKLDYVERINNVICKMKKARGSVLILPLVSQCLGDLSETPFFKSFSSESGFITNFEFSTEDPTDEKELFELRKNLLASFIRLYERAHTYSVYKELVYPDIQNVENYYRIVDEPMDLLTVIHKLELFCYTTPSEYEHDVKLMFQNARNFQVESKLFEKKLMELSIWVSNIIFKKNIPNDKKNIKTDVASTSKLHSRNNRSILN